MLQILALARVQTHAFQEALNMSAPTRNEGDGGGDTLVFWSTSVWKTCVWVPYSPLTLARDLPDFENRGEGGLISV